jgi:5-formyltetrahydrofolate cyclo-ligase
VKRELRERVRRQLAEIDPETMARKSARATDLLVGANEFRRAEVVMVFLSLPSEIDTTSDWFLRCMAGAQTGRRPAGELGTAADDAHGDPFADG